MPNHMKFHESQMPKPLIWAVIVICVLPFLLNLLGVDFGNRKIPLELSTAAGLERHEQIDVLHHTLAGSFTHTILEWSTFCMAIFVAILAFLHFSITHVTRPYDIAPLVLFVIAGVFIYPRFHRRAPIFSRANH